MTIEQAIEVIRKLFNAQGIDALTREELDALTTAIRSLEAWQKVKEELWELIEWHDCPIEYDGGNDTWYRAAIGMALVIIDKALGEVGEQDDRLGID